MKHQASGGVSLSMAMCGCGCCCCWLRAAHYSHTQILV
ncbi:hypothetical protein FLORINDA_39 [Mycobacterium phage Florinda]|uniref:Uncharacterized protein n=1 Tax=Mycobacterium phage Florinda TaxID=1675549 RepID=A0A0K1LRE5_9CAUD|nr:hypothetical protein FLORINDA_39 [Mycobacterium phage Florinda]AKU45009.1 hypothetical protein FLORINDA_39 [Mycobacterium phage Florinda]